MTLFSGLKQVRPEGEGIFDYLVPW